MGFEFSGLKEDLLLDFQGIMKLNTYKKNDKLHETNQMCNHLYIIQKGIARAFYYKDGKDITAHFAFENESITAIDSFIQRKKSKYVIEVLENSEVVSISHQDLHNLLDKKPEYEKFGRLFLEQIYVDLADRIEDLLFFTAKERYEKLIKNNAMILQRVNLGHIASYLGITQETLSRVRKG